MHTGRPAFDMGARFSASLAGSTGTGLTCRCPRPRARHEYNELWLMRPGRTTGREGTVASDKKKSPDVDPVSRLPSSRLYPVSDREASANARCPKQLSAALHPLKLADGMRVSFRPTIAISSDKCA